MLLNYYYLYFGTAPYSESCFLLLLIGGLFVIHKITNNDTSSNKMFFMLGILSGFIFLARQIGIVFIVYVVVYFIFDAFITKKMRSSHINALKNILLIAAGWALIFLPYSLILYYQSAKQPFQQSFRINQYVIHTQDKTVLEELNETKQIPEDNYNNIYHKRRLLRKLTPMSDEMLSHVFIGTNNRIPANNVNSEGLFAKTIKTLGEPSKFVSNFIHNLYYLSDPLGKLTFYIFLCTLVTPFVIISITGSTSQRLVAPIFLLVYFLALSATGDTISRYSYILFPLVFIHIFQEIFILYKSHYFSKIKNKSILRNTGLLFFLFLCYRQNIFMTLNFIHPNN